MALDAQKRPCFASDRRTRLSHNCTPACVVGQAVSPVNPVTLSQARDPGNRAATESRKPSFRPPLERSGDPQISPTRPIFRPRSYRRCHPKMVEPLCLPAVGSISRAASVLPLPAFCDHLSIGATFSLGVQTGNPGVRCSAASPLFLGVKRKTPRQPCSDSSHRVQYLCAATYPIHLIASAEGIGLSFLGNGSEITK
jgi:hypothetical protein